MAVGLYRAAIPADKGLCGWVTPGRNNGGDHVDHTVGGSHPKAM